MSDRLLLVEAALASLGKRYTRRGDRITAQCPAHDDRNPSFTATVGRDGGVLFHCYSGCGGAEIMDAMNMRWDQIKPDDYRAERKRTRPSMPDVDDLTIGIAAEDRRAGRRLNDRDQQSLRAALLRKHQRASA